MPFAQARVRVVYCGGYDYFCYITPQKEYAAKNGYTQQAGMTNPWWAFTRVRTPDACPSPQMLNRYSVLSLPNRFLG